MLDLDEDDASLTEWHETMRLRFFNGRLQQECRRVNREKKAWEYEWFNVEVVQG